MAALKKHGAVPVRTQEGRSRGMHTDDEDRNLKREQSLVVRTVVGTGSRCPAKAFT